MRQAWQSCATPLLPGEGKGWCPARPRVGNMRSLLGSCLFNIDHLDCATYFLHHPSMLAAIGAQAVAERRPPLDRRAAIHRAFRHHYCCGGGACDIDLRAERLKPAPAGARSRVGSPRPARLRIRRSPQRQAVVGGRPSARRHHRLFPARRRAAPYQRKY